MQMPTKANALQLCVPRRSIFLPFREVVVRGLRGLHGLRRRGHCGGGRGRLCRPPRRRGRRRL